jgi:hypothetical protein
VHQSPGKVKVTGGKSNHHMSAEEMREKYLLLEQNEKGLKLSEQVAAATNKMGSWSNREEEYYFSNKRLLFTTKSSEISDQWVQKLSALVTEE